MVETGRTIYPIEIKLASTIDSGRVGSLIKWLQVSHLKEGRAIVVSTSRELGAVGKNVVNCHYSLI